jgi:hypothetical protein
MQNTPTINCDTIQQIFVAKLHHGLASSQIQGIELNGYSEPAR